jgi:hypothetical protein
MERTRIKTGVEQEAGNQRKARKTGLRKRLNLQINYL